ncbi:hypothetical protein ABIE18_002733 [Arthrobacter sp. 2762]
MATGSLELVDNRAGLKPTIDETRVTFRHSAHYIFVKVCCNRATLLFAGKRATELGHFRLGKRMKRLGSMSDRATSIKNYGYTISW